MPKIYDYISTSKIAYLTKAKESCLPYSERPVGWGHRIRRLHLCRRVNLYQECPGYDTELSYCEGPRLELW